MSKHGITLGDGRVVITPFEIVSKREAIWGYWFPGLFAGFLLGMLFMLVVLGYIP